jgi:hypothetical protein
METKNNMQVAYFLRKVQLIENRCVVTYCLGKSATHKITRLLVAHFLKKVQLIVNSNGVSPFLYRKVQLTLNSC